MWDLFRVKRRMGNLVLVTMSFPEIKVKISAIFNFVCHHSVSLISTYLIHLPIVEISQAKCLGKNNLCPVTSQFVTKD